MVEGEGRVEKAAFDCAVNCYNGSERWRWDKDQNSAEGTGGEPEKVRKTVSKT